MKEKVIKIRGNGEASLAPDTIEIQFVLEKRDTDYGQAVQMSQIQLEQLRRCLAEEGFSKESLETTQFTVDTEYESVKNPSGDYTNVFRNYVVRHHLRLEFDLDPQRLGRVLQRISQCQAQPMLTIRYKLKDDQKLITLALENAFNNAVLQATVLVEAADVSIGEIIEIIHDEWSAVPFPARELLISPAQYKSTPVEFQPEKITLNASVLVTWKLV